MNYIVVDVGTQSLRSILFDETGKEVFSAQKPYSAIYRDLEVEQDPRTWKDTLIATLKSVGDFVKQENLQVKSISVTSQRASIIPVNEYGKYLYNAITWQDRRSYKMTEEVLKKMSLKDIYFKTGLRLDSYFSAPKMMWLKKHKKDVYDSAYKIIGVQDYVVYHLTKKFVTDHTQAARTLLMNIETFSWDEDLIDIFELDREKLCDLVEPGSVVGHLDALMSEKTGLSQDIKILLAGGDQQCAAIGLNVLKPGVVEANTGTGSFILGYSEKPQFDEKIRVLCTASAVPGKWVLEAGILTSGNIYSWFKKNFYDVDNYDLINQEVKESGVGARGVMLIPHFKGSAAPYWNPLSRGMFFNTSLESTRGDFARAILEGISIEMSQNIRLIEELVGYVEIVNIAGGLTVFDEFNQIQADVFNKAVAVYESAEATAMGALVSTLVSLGEYETHVQAYQALFGETAQKSYHSISEHVHKYITIRKIIRQLYHAIDDAQLYHYLKLR